MGKPRKYDYEKIIELSALGYSCVQITGMIGAKDRNHILSIIHKYQKEHPGWFPGINKENPEVKPLDTGKVRALHNAGWDIEKIHGEFGGNYSFDELNKAIAHG